MNKKDRIAVVISIVYFFILILVSLDHLGDGVIVSFPLLFYWGYRFIKNDISFIKMKDE